MDNVIISVFYTCKINVIFKQAITVSNTDLGSTNQRTKFFMGINLLLLFKIIRENQLNDIVKNSIKPIFIGLILFGPNIVLRTI